MFELVGVIFFVCACLIPKDFYQVCCLFGLSGLYFLIGSIYNLSKKYEQNNNLANAKNK